MNDQKQQIVEKVKSANNVLVTVSNDPSVDQLSACIGLTLLLNKIGKHATAVFSGKIPPAITFLKPNETIEKNTDSLRDFIIAIDKSKADKLRYKVEDEVVKIFITPYKWSISEKDLIYSQGDFNVDVVIALGVHKQAELDSAITAHGRILHDAVVVTINNSANGELGTINWQDDAASGMSELVSSLAADLGENVLDSQIATALLTGIVAETDHFGNQRTTPQTMHVSAKLLEAGADQQLVSNELGHEGNSTPLLPGENKSAKDKDPLKITHPEPVFTAVDEEKPPANDADAKPSTDQKDTNEPKTSAEKSSKVEKTEKDAEANNKTTNLDELLKEAEESLNLPPVINQTESAKSDNSDMPKPVSPKVHETKVIQPLSSQPVTPAPVRAEPQAAPAPEPADSAGTLAEIEEAVHSPHLEAPAEPQSNDIAPEAPVAPNDGDEASKALEEARRAVEDARKDAPQSPQLDDLTQPLEALNAVPVDLDLGHAAPQPEVLPAAPVTPYVPPAVSNTPGLPDYLQSPTAGPAPSTVSLPPTPPPMPPAFQPPMPPNPAVNEPAPLNMSPADQPVSFPMPPSISMPPPQTTPPTSTNQPPAGPPPPPAPPPMPPAFGPQNQ